MSEIYVAHKIFWKHCQGKPKWGHSEQRASLCVDKELFLRKWVYESRLMHLTLYLTMKQTDLLGFCCANDIQILLTAVKYKYIDYWLKPQWCSFVHFNWIFCKGYLKRLGTSELIEKKQGLLKGLTDDVHKENIKCGFKEIILFQAIPCSLGPRF